MTVKSAHEVIRTVRSETTGRVRHYLSTDGMQHRTQGAAIAYQMRLDWIPYPFGPNQPRTLAQWVERIEQLRSTYGDDSLLVIDSGYEGHELIIYKPSRADADPSHII